jgi:serralysin
MALADDIANTASFAQTLPVPKLVNSVPTTPPQTGDSGSIFNSTDNQLYAWTGSNWLSLSNSIATGQDFTPHTATSDFASVDMTIGGSAPGMAVAYSGPVSGLEKEYIDVTSDNLNISVSTPNWFIHSGSGNDAIAANSGTNVLDGGTGSNFLTGGSGTDTFFVDDRGATADIWSTVSGFHAGDAATIWGVTPQDFSVTWMDGQGAAGFTGLTLHTTASGQPTASLTLAGYTSADLSDGRLSVSFGTVGGSAYMYVHGNS